MPNRRSKEKLNEREQRRAAYQYLYETSYNDLSLSETVCRVDSEMITYKLSVQFGQVDPQAVPDAEHGLVLMDTYGRGTLQK